MREILFRAKPLDEKRWVYGYLLRDKIAGYMIQEIEEINSFVYVQEDTIQQYTGLQDKNGTKIFEGDVVKYNSIVCPEDATTGRIEMYHGPLSLLDGIGIISVGQCVPKMLKVIGNIHDNPELL